LRGLSGGRRSFSGGGGGGGERDRTRGVTPLTFVTPETPIEIALDLLVDKGILSCPVIENGQCTDIIDKLDLVSFALNDSAFLAAEDPAAVASILHQPVKAVLSALHHSGRCFFHPLPAASTMNDVLKQLVQVQRVALLDEGGQVAGIITQSDVIQIVNANQERLGPVMHQTIQSVLITTGIGWAPVITLSRDLPLGEALLTLSRSKIQGAAVVDSKGKFIGSFSTNQLKNSALRSLNSSHPETYRMPVWEYIGKVGTAPLTITDDWALGRVIGELVRLHHHRAYILHPDGCPKGVVPLADILTALAPHMHGF